jgi:hypothetical protein
MDRIRHRLLDLLRETLLEPLRHFTISRSVRHLARVLVAVGVVRGVGDLVLDGGGDLANVRELGKTVKKGGERKGLQGVLGRDRKKGNGMGRGEYGTDLLLCLLWELGVLCVGYALTLVVLHLGYESVLMWMDL